jgi:hypothetical protein
VSDDFSSAFCGGKIQFTTVGTLRHAGMCRTFLHAFFALQSSIALKLNQFLASGKTACFGKVLSQSSVFLSLFHQKNL